MNTFKIILIIIFLVIFFLIVFRILSEGDDEWGNQLKGFQYAFIFIFIVGAFFVSALQAREDMLLEFASNNRILFEEQMKVKSDTLSKYKNKNYFEKHKKAYYSIIRNMRE